MDVAAELVDTFLMEPLFYKHDAVARALPPASVARQSLTLWVLFTVGGWVMYFSCSGANYLVTNVWLGEKLFSDRRRAPRVYKEIWRAFTSIPTMGVLTTLLVLPELRGYGMLYDNVAEYGWPFWAANLVFFLIWSDSWIYWIHYLLHWGPFYKYIHKDHHAYVNEMSPFASHAFHPIDGWSQSVPYHVYVYIFPMHKYTYVGLFIFVNMWTISIHDQVFLNNLWWVNGSYHHSIHHSKNAYNYGQYFTFWDRIMGTHMGPPEWGEGTAKLRKIARSDIYDHRNGAGSGGVAGAKQVTKKER